MASRILSAAGLAPGVSATFRSFKQTGSVDISASAEAGSVGTIEAAAVHGFAKSAGVLVYVKALQNVRIGGEVIATGEFVEVEEAEAKRLVRRHQAEIADEKELAAARKGGK
jgi:hypothetical protein